ncbi:hypothetical protein KOAAANKH_03043 [Brevundimonas sp. NIBR10]|uniref:hypothetical protein n=1 Tax=Brevundimonas sp. NIBR10 TaxID=3015997 RepID=UPI0022F1CB32|nr:hypothetical protein [Brevundimonas sp. NIBR10]WGM48147.1 hypothetical protein KOAAANKH_03043 [Brevundimonas sp. NIBR10]
MAEGNTGNTSGGGNMGLAFIVGGLLVVVVIIAFFVFGRGGMPDTTKDINVDVNLPKVEAPSVPTPPST